MNKVSEARLTAPVGCRAAVVLSSWSCLSLKVPAWSHMQSENGVGSRYVHLACAFPPPARILHSVPASATGPKAAIETRLCVQRV